MNELFALSIEKINSTHDAFHRYLFDEIDWSQRLIGIVGGRGTGKTTLMLQYIKEKYKLSEDALYISMDDIYFSANSLISLADEFVKSGGKCLVIDEVHKYKTWSKEIKNMYDRYKYLKVIFSGSSILEIYKGEADLSRRALMYQLYGQSLREYIQLQHNKILPVFSLEDIIKHPNDIALSIKEQLKTPLKYYKEYLIHGYFPFYNEDKQNYHLRLTATINQVFETDLPAVYGIDYNAIIGLKKLLYIISRIVPYKPNISELSRQIGISRETVVKYLYFLHKAEVTLSLASDTFGVNALNKPEKIYLNNTNFMHALSNLAPVNLGTQRETFFYSLTKTKHQVNYTDKGDFILNNKYIFEIGGKNKTTQQIKNLQHAYIVKDDIEFAHLNIIPLWLFGFLY